MCPGHMHEPAGGKGKRLQAGARLPAERDRRIKQAERTFQQRQRRVTARHDQCRPRRPDGPDLAAHSVSTCARCPAVIVTLRLEGRTRTHSAGHPGSEPRQWQLLRLVHFDTDMERANANIDRKYLPSRSLQPWLAAARFHEVHWHEQLGLARWSLRDRSQLARRERQRHSQPL
jgi:hypothetical protein